VIGLPGNGRELAPPLLAWAIATNHQARAEAETAVRTRRSLRWPPAPGARDVPEQGRAPKSCWGRLVATSPLVLTAPQGYDADAALTRPFPPS